MPATKRTINPDLARERRNCTFDVEELARYWYGDQHKLDEKRARGMWNKCYLVWLINDGKGTEIIAWAVFNWINLPHETKHPLFYVKSPRFHAHKLQSVAAIFTRFRNRAIYYAPKKETVGWDEFNYHNKQKEKHYAKRALSDYSTTIIKSRNEVSKKEQIDALNDNSRSSNNNKQENSTTKIVDRVSQRNRPYNLCRAEKSSYMLIASPNVRQSGTSNFFCHLCNNEQKWLVICVRWAKWEEINFSVVWLEGGQSSLSAFHFCKYHSYSS